MSCKEGCPPAKSAKFKSHGTQLDLQQKQRELMWETQLQVSQERTPGTGLGILIFIFRDIHGSS